MTSQIPTINKQNSKLKTQYYLYLYPEYEIPRYKSNKICIGPI